MQTLVSIARDVALCLLVADLVSGLGHWFEDTWLAPGRSELLDRLIVLPNIDHHRRPGAMNARDYLGTNAGALALAVPVAIGLALGHVWAWQPWLAVVLLGHSNQIHAWAHTRRAPAIVRAFQRVGLLQSMRHHGLHHRRPYASRFCTMTDWLNPVLDGVRFWRALEWIAERLGARVQRATPARDGF